ncbi:spore germination protein, partial [Shouchella clausii]|uniref:spore germination protein n=1 Tax=Shouchella clausii TaxID=79880 RepID=UPI0015952401
IHLLKEIESTNTTKDLADQIIQIISVASINIILDWSELLDRLLAGNTVILINGNTKAITVGTQKIQSRSITEPTTQTVIKGPKDSFT